MKTSPLVKSHQTIFPFSSVQFCLSAMINVLRLLSIAIVKLHVSKRYWNATNFGSDQCIVLYLCIVLYCIVLYCIVSIHLYNASCSAHQSEVLPVRET